ncbi:MAG: alpha/beta hydrolase [Bacillota bacterium]
MKYKEFGNMNGPTIILLHGEHLSWWSFKDIIDLLKMDYHIVAPVIDGHGEDGETTFLSIQEAAHKLIQYIDVKHQGKVFALCGVSLGAQIVVEMLSERAEIAEYALVESTLVVPYENSLRSRFAASRLAYVLSRQKWLARPLAKALCVKPELFPLYYQDCLHISYASWLNIEKSRTGYAVPKTLGTSTAKVLIIIGSEEIKAMDKSVRLLMNTVQKPYVCVVPEMKHGELSLAHCTEYLALVKNFMM